MSAQGGNASRGTHRAEAHEGPRDNALVVNDARAAIVEWPDEAGHGVAPQGGWD